MSASLTEVLNTRRLLAAGRVIELADRAGESRSMAVQSEIEEALSDLRHYSSLENDLREVADDLGIYTRRSGRSVIADLRAKEDPAAVKRLSAAQREYTARGLEQRDLGPGTAIAAVPAWLVAEARPMSVKTAPLLTAVAKPLVSTMGLKVMLPTFTTEPTAGPQNGLGAALQAAAFVDEGYEAPVRTFGAQVKVSMQLVEQSPAAIDRQILPAMVAAVDASIEASLYTGAGTAGHVVGILETDGITEASYTDTTPTLVEMYPKVEGLVTAAETAGNRGGRPILLMHPRRLSWFRQTAVVEKVGLGWAPPQIDAASAGLFGGNVSVIADASIPTDQGIGTDQDVIVVMRDLDVLDLHASAPRLAVVSDSVNSGTLSATITVSRMVAFSAERLAGAVGVLSGTGLSNPWPS